MISVRQSEADEDSAEDTLGDEDFHCLNSCFVEWEPLGENFVGLEEDILGADDDRPPYRIPSGDDVGTEEQLGYWFRGEDRRSILESGHDNPVVIHSAIDCSHEDASEPPCVEDSSLMNVCSIRLIVWPAFNECFVS